MLILKSKLNILAYKLKNFLNAKDGMGTIEVVIIIAVLVALALIFKDFIIDLARGIFTRIQENADQAVTTL